MALRPSPPAWAIPPISRIDGSGIALKMDPKFVIPPASLSPRLNNLSALPIVEGLDTVLRLLLLA
jgi:hypothetical protein